MGEGDTSAASWIRELLEALPPNSPDNLDDILATFARRGYAVNAGLCVSFRRTVLMQ